MKSFYKVVVNLVPTSLQYINGKLVTLTREIMRGDAEVVGSKCESGLPSISPHSSTYSYLTLQSSIGSLNTSYLIALNATNDVEY